MVLRCPSIFTAATAINVKPAAHTRIPLGRVWGAQEGLETLCLPELRFRYARREIRSQVDWAHGLGWRPRFGGLVEELERQVAISP